MNAKKTSSREGATIILMLALLVLVFIFVAFSIDLGRVQLAQLKLQVASDFAARAGAEAMSRGVGDPSNVTNHEEAIRNEIAMVMQNNTVFGANVDFDSSSQIEFGRASRNGQKFSFTGSGGVNSLTNALRVDPNMNQFPMLFGGFTGRDSLALSAATTAKVQDRDIVLVLDRSSSMFEHDAGTIPEANYNANLRSVEDALYDSSSRFHISNVGSGSTWHTEFEVSGGTMTLSRIQAIKLAVLKFREEIDETRANEKLGLSSYNEEASQISDVETSHSGSSSVNIINGLTNSEYNAITQPLNSDDDSGSGHHCASSLQDQHHQYNKFDFQYLRMRCSSNTNIAGGIIRGTDILFGAGRRNYATPILIVMTDGNHNQASTPEEAATTVMAAHPEMMIYTITFGVGANQPSMETVAETGNGRHIHAENADELVTAFKNLATNAGVMVIE